MAKYYSNKLSASKLKRCYDIASPRIKQYLDAEINYTLKNIQSSDVVLELGCGYGRVLKLLAQKAQNVYGIDISSESLDLAKEYLLGYNNIKLFQMNAKALDFKDKTFDVVVAIQNGISAFGIEPKVLIQEAMRVTKTGGLVLLSSYSSKIWKERLEWFIAQSKEGLLGEINFKKTKKGKIICKDGFVATTFSEKNFNELIKKLNLRANIEEIDESSLFCKILV